MPIYVYEAAEGEKGCDECRGGFEAMQSLKDEKLTRCPKCGGRVSRVIQAPDAPADVAEKEVLIEQLIGRPAPGFFLAQVPVPDRVRRDLPDPRI